MKISIPKDFFENKGSLTPHELLTMLTDMVNKINETTEESLLNRQWALEQYNKIKALEQENKALREEINVLKTGGKAC